MNLRTSAGSAPVLVAAAHGTRDGRDRATVEALLDRVRALRAGLRTTAAYLQFAAPSVSSALIDAGGAAVVVPLLLSTGYHLRVDLPAALHHAAVVVGSAEEFSLAPALGPHELLAQALLGRVAAAGWRPGTPIVLAAAGSTDPHAAVDVREMARMLARRAEVPVATGFAAGSAPMVAQAVDRLRTGGATQVAVASYLIAPGRFHDLATASGADTVAPPLADHDALARLVLHRYDTALASWPAPGPANRLARGSARSRFRTRARRQRPAPR